MSAGQIKIILTLLLLPALGLAQITGPGGGGDITGTVTPTQGGTGLTTAAQGSLLYASATDMFSELAKDTNATRALCNTGTGNNPAWCQISLTTGITGILPSTNGGTGNGFTKFTGPATSEKTFTLPNASSTVLTSNAAVTVAQGGTGAATLTGLLKGNGTSPFTAATAADIPPVTLPTPSTSITLACPSGFAFCTGACNVTLGTPVPGCQACARNMNNVATAITLINITGVSFEATDRLSYYAANRKLASSGAATDQICVVGLDSTHYAVMSSTGTWTDTAP